MTGYLGKPFPVPEEVTGAVWEAEEAVERHVDTKASVGTRWTGICPQYAQEQDENLKPPEACVVWGGPGCEAAFWDEQEKTIKATSSWLMPDDPVSVHSLSVLFRHQPGLQSSQPVGETRPHSP